MRAKIDLLAQMCKMASELDEVGLHNDADTIDKAISESTDAKISEEAGVAISPEIISMAKYQVLSAAQQVCDFFNLHYEERKERWKDIYPFAQDQEAPKIDINQPWSAVKPIHQIQQTQRQPRDGVGYFTTHPNANKGNSPIFSIIPPAMSDDVKDIKPLVEVVDVEPNSFCLDIRLLGTFSADGVKTKFHSKGRLVAKVLFELQRSPTEGYEFKVKYKNVLTKNKKTNMIEVFSTTLNSSSEMQFAILKPEFSGTISNSLLFDLNDEFSYGLFTPWAIEEARDASKRHTEKKKMKQRERTPALIDFSPLSDPAKEARIYNDLYRIFKKTGRHQQANTVKTLSKKTAEGGSFHDGLRNGLDSAINLLKDAKDLNTVAEITSYLEEVRDSIRPGMVYENAPLSAKELQELMSFDV